MREIFKAPSWMLGRGTSVLPVIASMAILSVAACSPASLVDVQAPSEILPPEAAMTPEGATNLHNFAVTNFSRTLSGQGDFGVTFFDGYIGATGLFTDEFQRTDAIMTAGIDERNASTALATDFQGTPYSPFSQLYFLLQRARAEALQARQALQAYGPNLPKTMQSRMYSQDAYATLYFAEFFCSGIPLSTSPLSGKFVYQAGSTTEELFQTAIVLFDSALTTAGDSERFTNLARIGRARALLGLGRFAEAAQAVADIPTTYRYDVEYSLNVMNAIFSGNMFGSNGRDITITDEEGGVPQRWSGDPRVPIVNAVNQYGNATRAPTKYPTSTSPIRLADGIEARLIEAEADLDGAGTLWLQILNDLRRSCTTASGCAPVPGITETTFTELTDPALAPIPPGKTAKDVRLDLIIQERGYWLFATGHRQGDFRRLLRVYRRDQADVYPTGTYINSVSTFVQAETAEYGTDVVAVPDPLERKNNPKYRGCFNLNP